MSSAEYLGLETDYLPSSPAAKAAALVPWLRAQSARIEEARCIPPDVAERLAEADLFRMSQPAKFGGLELDLRQSWQAVFEVAQGCSSAAWLTGLGTANVLMLGKFSEEAQRDVFLCGKPAIVPMLTGGVGSNIRAEKVEGGVMLSGEWRYASGIDPASWVGLLVNLPVGEDGASLPYIVLVPQEAFEIDHDSWQVLGMRGTGSKNVRLDPVFVPEHRWMSWADLQSGRRHALCPNEGALYNYPLNPAFAMSVAAPTLGVAAAVAREYRDVVQKRVNSGTQQQQVQDKGAQIQVAAGEAAMTILRRNLLNDAAELLEKAADDQLVSGEDRAAARMRIAVSVRLALAETQKMFASLGGAVLPSGSRPERLFRDIHAMSSHFLLQPDPIGEAYGRLLLGLELPAGARL